MMQQNINLLTNLPKQQKTLLSVKQQLQILGALIVVLMLIYAVYIFPASSQQTQLNKLVATKNSLVTQLEDARKSISKINLLKDSGPIPTMLLETLAKITNPRGFSTQMDAMANDTPYGIWLTHFNISQSDNNILLNGNASSEALLPDYLKSLNTDNALYNSKFNTINLEKNKKDNTVTFTLSNLKTSSPAEIKEQPKV